MWNISIFIISSKTGLYLYFENKSYPNSVAIEQKCLINFQARYNFAATQ